MRTCWSRWRGAEATGERKDGGQEEEMRRGGRLLEMWNREEVMEQTCHSLDSFVAVVAYPASQRPLAPLIFFFAAPSTPTLPWIRHAITHVRPQYITRQASSGEKPEIRSEGDGDRDEFDGEEEKTNLMNTDKI
jgi:hypothetical protein